MNDFGHHTKKVPRKWGRTVLLCFFIAMILLNVISYIHIFKLVSLQIAHGTMVQKKKELPGPHCSKNKKRTRAGMYMKNIVEWTAQGHFQSSQTRASTSVIYMPVFVRIGSDPVPFIPLYFSCTYLLSFFFYFLSNAAQAILSFFGPSYHVRFGEKQVWIYEYTISHSIISLL
jgi:hypothetical protein